MIPVSVRQVVNRHGPLEVIRGISLDIAPGELIVLAGPLGCGNSVLLDMIAGRESYQSGQIAIGGHVVNGLPVPRSIVSLLLQERELFQRMTVEWNLGFSLKVQGAAAIEIADRVYDAATVLQIEHLLDRPVYELSAQNKLLLTLARMIAGSPQLLLIDESSLIHNPGLCVTARSEIARLHQQLGATIIYATSDQTTAMAIADRVVVMNGGRIEQEGPPGDLYRNPATLFVAGFIGAPGMNLIRIHAGGNAVALPKGNPLPIRSSSLPLCDVVLGVRPEHLHIDGAGIETTVEAIQRLGADMLVTCRMDDDAVLTARLARHAGISPGDRLVLAFDEANARFFDPRTGLRL